MTDMVERVARAISIEILAQYAGGVGPMNLDGERMARAAIEAMREPSEAMLEAGDNAHASHVGYQYSAVAEVWEAMIEEAFYRDDAALSQSGDSPSSRDGV